MENIFEKDINVHKWKLLLRQVFVSSTAWVNYFMFGLCLGTPTVTIPQLRKKGNSPDSVSDEMASLISAIVGYFGMICVPMLTILLHFYGRKLPATLVTINACAAFIVLYCSRSATHVLVAQILHGMTAASQTTICLMLVTEYTMVRYRGVFLTIKCATVYWGVWAANAIGTFCDYRIIGIPGVLCTVYNLIAFYYIPESPYWLSEQGRYADCITAHRWLKGVDQCAEKELQALIGASDNDTMGKKKRKSIRERFDVTVRNMCLPEVYKPLLIVILILCMYHSTGKFVCTLYSLEMIKKITKSESMAYTGMLVLDGFTVLGMYTGCIFSKILKRRTMLLTFAVIGAFFMFTMSTYLYLIKFSLITENNYFSMTILILYSLSICCGPIMLSSALISEMAPLKSRGLCLCLSSLFSKFLIGTVLHIAPFIFKSCGFHGTFFVFGLMFSFTLSLVYKYLPETKDKTLHEISECFRKKIPETEPLSLKGNNSKN